MKFHWRGDIWAEYVVKSLGTTELFQMQQEKSRAALSTMQ